MTEAPVFTQISQNKFPILELPRVEQTREDHKLLLKRLFPQAVRLRRLILDVEHNFSKEIASIFGSVDFAHARLAGFLSALGELESQVLAPNAVNLVEIREQIRNDHRIHEILEDLVFECTVSTLDSNLL